MPIEFHKHMLRFMVMPTRFPSPENKKSLEKAYECWRSVWGQALSEEMNVKEDLYSDNFTRKSHVAVVFYGEKPLGLCTSNLLNLHNKQDLDDSYFKVWPPAVMDELKKNATTIMTCCNATLDFNFRRSTLGFSGLELVFAMLVLYFKTTDVDLILGTPRLEKGVEKLCYQTGAMSLATNLPYSIPGQIVDLVCWKQDIDISKWDPQIRELAEYIWKNSTQIVPYEKGDRYAA